ncbi:hypothetical protein OL548_27055 [Lysinibacillus sp. MHQ-1]|nr:hypothetical protein OL548_27055 [Lysinibacillus sp. MHQ-1]
MDKTTLRNKVRETLAMINEEVYRRQSKAVVQRVLQEPYIIEANTIGITISNQPEVDTILLIEELWQLGKKGRCAKVPPQNKRNDILRH